MRDRSRLGLLIILLGLSLGGGFVFQASTQPVPRSIPNTATMFDAIRPALQRTHIPLRLPTYIPMTLNPEPGYEPPPIQASLLQQPSSRGYEIVLGYTPNCSGGNACRFGTVTGRLKPNQSIEADYAWVRTSQERKSKEPMQPVKLNKNITGWFIPWTCGASCGDAKVIWNEYAYRYSVGVKLGDKTSLVKMANSAIEAGQK